MPENQENNNFYIDKRVTMAEAILYIFASISFIVPWVFGVVLAPSWWQALLAVPFFPYAWYLTAERIAQMAGIIPSSC